MAFLQFPPDFVWGTATASYQIEGAWNADGKGESIWDRFAHTPGKIKDGSDGDVACDHYHRFPEDIAVMKSLGMKAYRFSIGWPRILPEGRGRLNIAGIDFYSRLVDRLLEAGITPYATLYHWDLPQALDDQGGWPARATAEAFAEYADVVSRAMGDRVKHWITLNEPWCISILGHQIGGHAPGRQEWPAALRAAHHALLAHGLAVPVLRRNSPGAEVAITLNFTHADPASPSAEDYHAARLYDGYFQRWFLDPVYGRGYPADMVEAYTRAGYLPQGMDFVQPGDTETIAAPTDFLGVNYYTRAVLRAGDEVPPGEAEDQKARERTDMGWEICPEGLYVLLCRLHFEYRIPKIVITENGASYGDGPDAGGRVADARRTEYLKQHFAAAHRAMAAGVPLAGYFIWSLMDNFEWAEGYRQRFGIVFVDYATQQRIPKESASWVRDVIDNNGFALP
jgi:beta-glucosidase